MIFKKNKMPRIVLKGIVVVSMSTQLFGAVVIEQNLSDGPGTSSVLGQSFTWSSGDALSKVGISYANTDNKDMAIYDGELASCTVGLDAPYLYKVSNVVVTSTHNTPNVNGYTEFTINPPLALTNGNKYTICTSNTVNNNLSLSWHTGNPYTGGVVIYSLGQVAAFDLAFKLESAPTAPTSVPIGPLGLLALLAGILGTGFMSLRAKS